MITVIERTLTPTEVKNGATTLIKILNSPASGYVRNIFSITERIEPVSVAYDGPTSSQLCKLSDGTYIQWTGTILADQTFEHDQAFELAVGAQKLITTKDEIWWQAAADSTVGDGIYSIIVVYEDKLILVS